MSERLTESEWEAIRYAAYQSPGGPGDPLQGAVERILADRLAARGAGDGVAGRVAALHKSYQRTKATNGWRPGDWCQECEVPYPCPTAALLDPDAQGADEGGGS